MSDLKTLRALTGMTQKALAGLLQISRSHIAMIKSGQRSLPPKNTDQGRKNDSKICVAENCISFSAAGNAGLRFKV